MKVLQRLMGAMGGARSGAGGAADVEAARAPIAGVTMEQYADLCGRMARVPEDPDVWAAIAAEQGFDRDTWEAARCGWTERLENPATARHIVIDYMPIYQASLAAHGGPAATASYEDYIEMTAMINTALTDPPRPHTLEPMYERFGITVYDWSQISTHWVQQVTTDRALAEDFAKRTEARIKELDAEWQARNG